MSNQSRQRRLLALALVGAACSALSILGAAPANASQLAPASTAPAQNCGYIESQDRLICAAPTANLDVVVANATGSQIVGENAGAVKPSARSTSVSPDSLFVLAKLYDDKNYGGSYYELYGQEACSSSTGYTGRSDIGSSWYNRVSSFQGFSNCRVKIWENTGYTGATLGYYASQSYVGDALNDRTKSFKASY